MSILQIVRRDGADCPNSTHAIAGRHPASPPAECARYAQKKSHFCAILPIIRKQCSKIGQIAPICALRCINSARSLPDGLVSDRLRGTDRSQIPNTHSFGGNRRLKTGASDGTRHPHRHHVRGATDLAKSGRKSIPDCSISSHPPNRTAPIRRNHCRTALFSTACAVSVEHRNAKCTQFRRKQVET